MRKNVCILLACILLIPLVCHAEDPVVAPAYPVPRYVEWLLDIARAEVGYKEGRGGYTKYGEWAGDPTCEWCAEYLCWCVDQVDQQHGTALLTVAYPKYSAQNVGMRWFLREGRFIARTGRVEGWGTQWYIGQEEPLGSNRYVPQPGDWAFFSVDGTNTSHVAMVEYCTQNSLGEVTVHVLEGNLPDKVQRNTYALSDKHILGYGTVHDVADIVMQGGCEGKKVTALQQKLCYLGYLSPEYVNGVYGASTVQAVKDFQLATGKTATGIANQHTQITLGQMYKSTFWSDDGNFTVTDDEW